MCGAHGDSFCSKTEFRVSQQKSARSCPASPSLAHLPSPFLLPLPHHLSSSSLHCFFGSFQVLPPPPSPLSLASHTCFPRPSRALAHPLQVEVGAEVVSRCASSLHFLWGDDTCFRGVPKSLEEDPSGGAPRRRSGFLKWT